MISVDDAKINHIAVAMAQTAATTLATPGTGMEWLLIPKDADCTAVLLVMLQRAWKRSRALGNMVAVVFLVLLQFVRGLVVEELKRWDLFSTLFVNRKSQKENFDAHKKIWIVTSWFELDVLSNKVDLEDKYIVYW